MRSCGISSGAGSEKRRESDGVSSHSLRPLASMLMPDTLGFISNIHAFQNHTLRILRMYTLDAEACLRDRYLDFDDKDHTCVRDVNSISDNLTSSI